MGRRHGAHAVHTDLIQRVCASNPGTRADGFWRDFTRIVLEESGDPSDGDWRADDDERDLDDVPDEEVERGAREWLKRRSGGLLPDAWSAPDDAMCVVIWEICNTRHVDTVVDKWDRLAIALDAIDAWDVFVVTVDARGLCHVVDPSDKDVVWHVDQPCPVRWGSFYSFTNRAGERTPAQLARDVLVRHGFDR